MESEAREERESSRRPDDLVRASGRAAVLAPGGFAAGYLIGRSLGNLVAGCSPIGPCDAFFPTFLAIPTSVIGMGVACTLAAARVGRWWEGLAVWAAGILAMLIFVVLMGWLGPSSVAGRMLAFGWLSGAVALGIIQWKRGSSLLYR